MAALNRGSRPNVLLILADDLGYGDFGLFNGGLTRTPVLDALAAQGLCLTQHYSGSPICAPSRASLLTGRYAHRTGALETRELRGLCNLALRERTLGDVLSGEGYATGYVGKWHNGCLLRRFHPNARGFAEFVGFRSGWQDYWRWILDRNGTFERSDGRYLTEVFTDEGIAFLRRHRDGPFFLLMAYNAPHTPLQAPEELVRPYAERGRHTRAVSTIYAMVEALDRGVGRLLEELDRLGLRDDTLVMFTSDNGPQFGGEGEGRTHRFNCNFNGAKGNVYEGGIRVPMLLRWPGGLDAGRTCDRMVHFCDWFPTLLAAAGAAVPQGLALDGRSVLPALRELEASGPPPRFWQWNRYEPVIESNAAMRDGDWKLVRPVIRESVWTDPEEQRRDGELRSAPWEDWKPDESPFPERRLPAPPPAQLFNIAEDPCESRDLAAAQPERVASMLAALSAWFEEVGRDRRSIGDRWTG